MQLLITFCHVSPATAGKKNKLRVYYLSWLRNKILHNDPEVEKKQGWTTVGDLEGCVHYKVGTSKEVGTFQFDRLSTFTHELRSRVSFSVKK